MSDLGALDDPVFKGHTPGSVPCEEFVRAVRRHAVVEKKARDDEYIADYAMSCMDGEALHWSENLSTEVQGDWSLLRRALLSEYGTANRPTSNVPTIIPSAMLPVAAAAPPLPLTSPVSSQIMSPSPSSSLSTSTAIIGRIRVIVGSASYYLSKHLEGDGLGVLAPLCQMTRTASDAAIVQGIEIGGKVEFQISNMEYRMQSSRGAYLAVEWWTDNAGRLTTGDIQGQANKPKILSWIRSKNNELHPRGDTIRDAGGIAAFQLRQNQAAGGSISIVSDLKKFMHQGDVIAQLMEAQFVLEPI